MNIFQTENSVELSEDKKFMKIRVGSVFYGPQRYCVENIGKYSAVITGVEADKFEVLKEVIYSTEDNKIIDEGELKYLCTDVFENDEVKKSYIKEQD